MWQVLIDHFRRYPAQERVVRLMIAHGFSVRPGRDRDGSPMARICAGPAVLADVAVARAAGVDRRIVRTTAETIAGDERLRDVFSRTRPALDLRDVAPALGCGVIEVMPDDPHKAGILAGVSRVISEAGFSVRQAIGEDPDFQDTATLYVVTATPVPPDLLPLLRAVDGVRDVTVH